MISFKLDMKNESGNVKRGVEKARKPTFFRAAFHIRRSAAQSIEKSDGPSAPGSPPHTHRRIFLRRAIRYAANREGAVIGPRFSAFGTAGAAHEFGGRYKGTKYPKRPFMRPALEANTDKFLSEWRGAVTS